MTGSNGNNFSVGLKIRLVWMLTPELLGRKLSRLSAFTTSVAKAIGGAVMVFDNREGDLQHDYYRPAAMQRLRAGLDADGRIVAWDHIIASCSRNAYRKDPRGEHSTETYGSYVGRCSGSSSSMPTCSRRAFQTLDSAMARR